MGSDPLARIVAGIAPHVDAISGINTIRMGVLDRAGAATFGSRPSAGVSGVAIRELGLKFVRRLVDLKRAEAYTFDVIGMGGVMTAADILAYLDAGATVVQSATGAFFNPYLAVDLREAMGAGIGGEAGLSRLSDLAPTAADVAVLAALRLGPASVPELSAATMMVPSEVRHTIARLIAAGLVSRNQVGLLALTKEGAGFDRNVRRGQPGIVAPSTEMPTVQELDDALDRVLARLT
jgi:DNA-binding transcriptional ArsR family regulator